MKHLVEQQSSAQKTAIWMPDSNDRNINCPNGHSFATDELTASSGDLTCPECGSEIREDSNSSSRTSRSLWDVMGRPANDETTPTGAAPAAFEQDESEVADAPLPEDTPFDNDSSAATTRPHGLWAMMGATQSDEATTSDEDKGDLNSSIDFDEVHDEDESDYLESDSEKTEAVDLDEYEDDLDEDQALADDDEEDGWEVDSPLHDLDAADSIVAELSIPSGDQRVDHAAPPKFPQGTGAVVAGILSVLLSGLNLLPWFAAGIPSTVMGAYALLLGYQTLGSNRRNRENAPGLLAPVAMLLGLVGIFSGPAYLNGLGDSWRNRSTREVIESNLGGINKALNDYAIEKGHFPAGGIFVVDEQGLEVGMHSWMTSLLPYLGHMAAYDSIDQSRPWNDDANSDAMSRPISTFLIPTVPHEPTPRGHATAHFAGVGGLIQTDQGLLPTGIFGKNSAVRIDDVTDGTSNTIIAGEIARALPAWGDPENWRTIEGPLNRQLSSFGNAAGTGAHFLQGDGSVRFFSNRTSLEVLQRLATRDAND